MFLIKTLFKGWNSVTSYGKIYQISIHHTVGINQNIISKYNPFIFFYSVLKILVVIYIEMLCIFICTQSGWNLCFILLYEIQPYREIVFFLSFLFVSAKNSSVICSWYLLPNCWYRSLISAWWTVLVNKCFSAQQMYAQVCARIHAPTVQLVWH